MSLTLGKAFITALRASDTLQQLLGATKPSGASAYSGARIYAVGRTNDQEREDAIPYLIMMPEGINTDGTKDDYEQTDSATIALLCVATTFEQLITLTGLVRGTIHDHLGDTSDTEVCDYTFSASAVQYDPDKPCFFQTLTYVVSTQSID